MYPTVWDWTISQWFEVVPLSSEDLDQIARQFNLFLRPEGHFARVLPHDGRVLIGVRIRAEHPAQSLERLLRCNGIEAYFLPLVSAITSAIAR